jgi:flagellar FliJ protein
MKRFSWRLQHVLDIKSQQEQLKKAELFKVTEKLAERRGQLARQQRILKQLLSGIAAEQSRLRLAAQELFLKHSITNDGQIEELRRQVRELEGQQRQQMDEILRLRRFRRGLEKLRAAAKLEFIGEQEKLEQKELDEMAQIRFARSGPVPGQLNRPGDVAKQEYNA